MGLISRAMAYHMDSHRSNPVNLMAGSLGMIINNLIYLAGMWGMLFAGKSENAPLIPYYVALNSVVMFAWGGLNFFFGGIRNLGDLITEGALEPMLATPRQPLLLAGISQSHVISLGDFLMGLAGLILLAFLAGMDFALRAGLASLISLVGFVSLFILAGSFAFFIGRGNQVGHLLIEVILSLSLHPSGKIFTGRERLIILLTPAAATALLPIEAVEKANLSSYLAALGAAVGFFLISLLVFRIGIKRYQSVSLVGTRL